MWDVVAQLVADKKARWQGRPQDAELDGDDDGTGHVSACLDAVRLARHLGKPVIADDRFLQVLMYLEDSGSTSRAFSSAHFLLAMLESGYCSEDIVAADFHRLMCWRYRFLTPPPRLLLAWAKQSIANPPGDALLNVAVYLHDCLRDPGLHCGLEQTTTPMPIAVKFVTAWFDSIARFVAGIWADDAFVDESAIRFTQWVGEDLIPSCPRGLWLRPVEHNPVRVGPATAIRMRWYR